MRSAETSMTERWDGCPEFDARLIDLAAEPVAATEVEAHVATCARCRDALDRYEFTGRAIAAALMIVPDPPAAAPRPARAARFDRTTSWAAATVAATLVVAATVLLTTFRAPTPPLEVVPRAATPSLAVLPEDGAVIQYIAPDHARIETGTSTFVIRDGASVVETPVGPMTCDGCEFTVAVGSCCVPTGTSVHPSHAAPSEVCVTLSVVAGWVGRRETGREIALLGPGETRTWQIMEATLLERVR